MSQSTPVRIVGSIYAAATVATAGLLLIGEERLGLHGDQLAVVLLAIWVPLGYGLPTFIAIGRRHPHRYLLLVANVLLGFTGLGWLACLAWSAGYLSLTVMRPRS